MRRQPLRIGSVFVRDPDVSVVAEDKFALADMGIPCELDRFGGRHRRGQKAEGNEGNEAGHDECSFGLRFQHQQFIFHREAREAYGDEVLGFGFKVLGSVLGSQVQEPSTSVQLVSASPCASS
jgi:hypothetical protein